MVNKGQRRSILSRYNVFEVMRRRLSLLSSLLSKAPGICPVDRLSIPAAFDCGFLSTQEVLFLLFLHVIVGKFLLHWKTSSQPNAALLIVGRFLLSWKTLSRCMSLWASFFSIGIWKTSSQPNAALLIVGKFLLPWKTFSQCMSLWASFFSIGRLPPNPMLLF